jgi:catechol 2,3-dioxygenase-like lactoylglutathione lyase family enzyme
MSLIFGPCVQQGYVVPDIQAAMQHWLARGVGPFYIEEHISPPAEFDGRPFTPDISAAFAYCGEQQIELVQQHDDQATVYSEFLRAQPAGGLQHLAFWCDDVPRAIAELGEAGLRYRVRQRYGDMHAYLDSEDAPGIMVQLMDSGPMMSELFAVIKQGAETWDGVTDPIRSIDWSSGAPVIHPVG